MIRVSLLALLLTGCVANQIAFDRGQFCLAYADLKAAASVQIARVRDACHSGAFDLAVCADFEASLAQLLRVETEVRKGLANPDQAVDWSRVLEYTTTILALAAKAL